MPEVQNSLSNSCQYRRNWKDHHLGMDDVRAPLDVRYRATISKFPAHRNYVLAGADLSGWITY